MSPNSESGGPLPSDPFGSAERINRAAAREAARGRRVLWLYVALSLVPVLAAVMFLRYGRTDRELVESEVQAQVAPVKTEVEQVRPALQEVKQLGTLALEVRNLGAVASEVRGTATKVEEHDHQLQQLRSRTDAVASTIDERQAQVDTLRTEAQALRAEISTLRAEQARRFEEIHRVVEVNINELRGHIDARDRELIRRIESERVRPHRPGADRPPE